VVKEPTYFTGGGQQVANLGTGPALESRVKARVDLRRPRRPRRPSIWTETERGFNPADRCVGTPVPLPVLKPPLEGASCSREWMLLANETRRSSPRGEDLPDHVLSSSARVIRIEGWLIA
jgi:hypothetical protein